MEVERLTRSVLHSAAGLRASDIHILPRRDGGIIRCRISGELEDMQHISSEFLQKMIAHLKFLSGMDIGERRRPQNSSFEIYLKDTLYALRLSTFPMTFSETMVVRMHRQATPEPLKSLTLFPSQAVRLKGFTTLPHGLILLCGPTGSGKTTTLYSLMHEMTNGEKRNIITLEDPVEQQHDQFLQMEVNEKAGVTYAHGLKNVLRHDPDVIMLGEIRDDESARMAVRAAMTGHLVLSTLHASSPSAAVRRLEEFGISQSDISETLTAVCVQTLVRLACPYCSSTCDAYCRKGRKRAALFDILSGDELQRTIAGCGPVPPKIGLLMKKAYALGYLSGSEIEKWVKRIDVIGKKTTI
ncbi:competence type IV pilus ATPase ComGA [Alteribacter natronophilus]|uniref:competence type IV pilus ATPase ComGA n=1 Tax=Alteribacter natronophilus TaxID=2583810 RepID=UPI001FEAEAFB|nr:competence type IV pilus ATPase ComGA [Alteribacter natronophilus]